MTEQNKKLLSEAFLQLPTGNISDAMDKLGIRRGAVSGVLPNEKTACKAVGFARTIQQMRRKTAYDGKNLAKQASIIDSQTEPGDLLVIDMTDIRDVCTGGALLAKRMKIRGVVGELTNGCLRDAEELAEMKFPVYFGGTSPVKSAMDVETVGVDVPVMIGGVQICPGDLICMDRSGVVVVPSVRAAEVLEAAQEIRKREAKMEKLILEGFSIVEARNVR